MSDASPSVLALDIGTTGVRALRIDATGSVRAQSYEEVLPTYPGPGLVEHDTEATLRAVHSVLRVALADAPAGSVRGLGLTSQRSTAVVWDSESGQAVHPAISWQDARSYARCMDLLGRGIPVVPLVAASKVEWLLDLVDADRTRVRAGALRCGTLESWLVWRLSDGRIFATDHSCGSSSGFYDPAGPRWHEPTLEALRIPLQALPALVDSCGVLGEVGGRDGLPTMPLAALIGDQQSAMMGQLRTEPGEVKITYGTAAMLDLHAGTEPLWPSHGGYPLVLWSRDGRIEYCLEGTAVTAGAAITWLRDGLGIIATPDESGTLAASVPDSGGVWAVPAFQGLGTPYMDTNARAAIGGLSRASTRAHLARAVLEGIAWRCREVYEALRADSPGPAPSVLRVDGGAARNEVLLQAQADALGLPIERPAVLDAAALGAAYLAGLATGVWSGTDELRAAWHADAVFEPRLGSDEREARFALWQRHVTATRAEGPLA
jgi:glycerol kinase